MTIPATKLPPIQELIAQVLACMNQNRDDEAMALLRQGLARQPGHGLLNYLLGSLHAQHGMIDAATTELGRAVEALPDLHVARFQLGLLYFTSANLEAASATWEPLARLAPDDPLALFRRGLIHLAHDEFAECVDLLRQGIARNAAQPALSRNMEMVIAKAEEALRAQPPVAAEQHVLLSGYDAAGKSGNPG